MQLPEELQLILKIWNHTKNQKSGTQLAVISKSYLAVISKSVAYNFFKKVSNLKTKQKKKKMKKNIYISIKDFSQTFLNTENFRTSDTLNPILNKSCHFGISFLIRRSWNLFFSYDLDDTWTQVRRIIYASTKVQELIIWTSFVSWHYHKIQNASKWTFLQLFYLNIFFQASLHITTNIALIESQFTKDCRSLRNMTVGLFWVFAKIYKEKSKACFLLHFQKWSVFVHPHTTIWSQSYSLYAVHEILDSIKLLEIFAISTSSEGEIDL